MFEHKQGCHVHSIHCAYYYFSKQCILRLALLRLSPVHDGFIFHNHPKPSFGYTHTLLVCLSHPLPLHYSSPPFSPSLSLPSLFPYSLLSSLCPVSILPPLFPNLFPPSHLSLHLSSWSSLPPSLSFYLLHLTNPNHLHDSVSTLEKNVRSVTVGRKVFCHLVNTLIL